MVRGLNFYFYNDIVCTAMSAIELAPLCFNKLHITSVPDEYIISTQQVEIELEKIRLQKAIGPDDIPNWVLKSAAPLLAGPICSVFNASIAQGCIPTLWKSADVIPAPKISNPKSVDSDLRPISLTPVLSKLLESFVFRLYLYLLCSFWLYLYLEI